jgi:hypothetical protein
MGGPSRKLGRNYVGRVSIPAEGWASLSSGFLAAFVVSGSFREGYGTVVVHQVQLEGRAVVLEHLSCQSCLSSSIVHCLASAV